MPLTVRARTGCLVLLLPPLWAACRPTEPSGSLNALSEYQEGLITFYDADGSGNCSYDPSPDRDVAAMNIGQYQDSAVCGACVEVEGPKATLTVRIVDSCPDCPDKGHLDLSREAFAKIATPADGRVKVHWRMVPLTVQGPVRYHFEPSSSAYWAAIQVRNHRVPVTRLEYSKNGAWVNIPRESYNYFVQRDMGPGPLKVRLTGSNGQTLEDTLPTVAAGQTLDGAGQFR